MDFAFIGLGIIAVSLAVGAYVRVEKLEKELRGRGILPDEPGNE